MTRMTIVLLLVASAGAAQEEPVDMLTNVHEMRMLLENAAAQDESEARSSTIGAFFGGDPGYSPSAVGQMRRDMLDTFEYLEKKFPCVGAEMKIEEGQGILICGDNNGYAGNQDITTGLPAPAQIPPQPLPGSDSFAPAPAELPSQDESAAATAEPSAQETKP